MAVKGLGRRFSLWLAEWIYFLLARFLFASCRISITGEGYRFFNERIAARQPFIVAFWHYATILMPYFTKGKKWVAMVSASSDGDYIARVLESIGYVTVRGSRNRRGAGALKEMIKIMAEGYNAAIIADGSQGPARQAQPGAILLAAHSGCPIIPIAWSASSYWTFRSWDRTALPKPFARVEVIFNPPLAVPRQIRGGELEDQRQRLEQALHETYAEVWRRVGKKEH
jgi:lysophospholipid acyltransferase (LPLAT)-like uncharacterized protein